MNRRFFRIYSILLFQALLLPLVITSAHAARAVFSADGTRIYFAGGRFKMLDLNHPDHLQMLTSSTLWGEKIHAISRANNGDILCLTAHHLGSYDPQRRTFRPLRDAAPGEKTFADVAVNPQNGYILLTAGSPGYYGADEAMKFTLLQPDDPTPMKVFSRRVYAMEGPIFDRQGQLYFSYESDLWRGGIDMEKTDADETSTPANMRGVLNAERIAPLGRPETALGTPEGMRVMEIAPAGKLIYIQTQRMYGTGWGSLLTLAAPAENLKRRDGIYDDFIATLSSVKVIDSTPSGSYLCISPDGRTVFYRVYQDMFLIKDGGKPAKLPLQADIWDK